MKKLLASLFPCPLCHNYTQNFLCKNCIQAFTFAPLQCFHKRNFLYKTIKSSQPLILNHQQINMPLRINTYFICLYKYTYITKQLFKLIKFKNNRIALFGLHELFQHYIYKDPFNISLYIRNLLKQANIIFAIYLPMSHSSKFKRNINLTKYIFNLFCNYCKKLMQQHTHHNIIQLENIFQTSKSMRASQKQLNRAERITNIKRYLSVNHNQLHTKLKNIPNLFHKSNSILFIFIDDITTTGVTLYYSAYKLINLVINNYARKDDILNWRETKIQVLFFSMFCVDAR